MGADPESVASSNEWYKLPLSAVNESEDTGGHAMDKAVATQLANIEKRTGRTLSELSHIIKTSGLSRHGELVAMLKTDLGMGHGDANTLVHVVLMSDGASRSAGRSTDDVVQEIYAGPKAALRPIHDKVMSAIDQFGPFEIAPKKGYLSLRRHKQFAMIGPATNSRIEVGLNVKDLRGPARLEAQKPGGMCQFKVKLTDPSDVDAELIAWIRRAYEGAA
jgi:hypothetical protein